jgi:hypothetical protein
VTTLLASSRGSEVWHADSTDPDAFARIMGGRIADALIVDAPYSEKTHSGHDGGTEQANGERARQWGESALQRKGLTAGQAQVARYAMTGAARQSIDYAAWSTSDVAAACSVWLPSVTGWCVSITDNVLAPAWSDAFEAAGRYVFAPLPWVETGSRVRLTGDGPSGWT